MLSSKINIPTTTLKKVLMKSNLAAAGRFAQTGNTFFPFGAGAPNVHPLLPTGVYVLMQHPEKGYYLEGTESFKLPTKLYGSTTRESTRILSTFLDRAGTTGVLLAGEAGSGKTLLAKQIALEGMKEHDMPVILVNRAHCGDAFNAFIQGINQPAMVFFDEFEKIYDDEDQEKILTLLDGTVTTQKLFVFTVNNKYAVNKHMQNRPGRIYYFKEYKGVDAKFIREYCEDNLKIELQVHIPVIEQYATMFYVFNFDMLKAIVEEMNRYDETPQQALALLNARPGFSADDIEYELVVTDKASDRLIQSTQYSGNPLIQENFRYSFNYWADAKGVAFKTAEEAAQKPIGAKMTDADMKRIDRKASYLSNDHLIQIDKAGTMHFENETFRMVLTKAPEKEFDALGYMNKHSS